MNREHSASPCIDNSSVVAQLPRIAFRQPVAQIAGVHAGAINVDERARPLAGVVYPWREIRPEILRCKQGVGAPIIF